MLDVSAAYTAAIKEKVRNDRITGTIKLCGGETITITDDLILNNSVPVIPLKSVRFTQISLI